MREYLPPCRRKERFEDIVLASRNELSEFLVTVERRAYKQALFAVRDEQAALDIVQDSMLKLSEKYGGKPSAELPMLFQRILQNTIRDYYRRYKVRATWMTLLSSILSGRDAGDEADPLETLAPAEGSNRTLGPTDHLEKSQLIVLIENEVESIAATSTRGLSAALLGGIERYRDRTGHGLFGGQRQDPLLTCGAYLGHSTQAQGGYIMNERKFGHQIKQQLDRTLDLEAATLGQLKVARERALAHQRVAEPSICAGVGGRRFRAPVGQAGLGEHHPGGRCADTCTRRHPVLAANADC